MVGPSERLRAGVVGLRRGLSFVRLLQAMDDVELVAVADLDAARLEAVRRDQQVPHGCATLEELLQLDLDLLVIATPPARHAAHAIAALDAGVHVLCEVPAVAGLEDGEDLLAAVQRSGRQYMLAENCCYWAVIDAAQQFVRRGTFGQLFYAEAEYIHHIPQLRRTADGRPTWRAALEPIVYCTHSLGPLLWIGGQYPVQATCSSTGAHFDADVPDLQVAVFQLTDGGVARVTCSFANAHWGGHRYALFGTRASLDTGWVGRDQPRFWSLDVPHLSAPVALPIGTDVPGLVATARLGGHGTAEWRMIRAFLQAVRTGRRAPIDVYDALMYSVPGLCAREAAHLGRPVPVPQYQLRRPEVPEPGA